MAGLLFNISFLGHQSEQLQQSNHRTAAIATTAAAITLTTLAVVTTSAPTPATITLLTQLQDCEVATLELE
jgi:hypothetical protein